VYVTPQQFDFSNNPFFRDLFGDRGQQQPPQESLSARWLWRNRQH
jgi:hypothetical protein